VSFSKYPNNLDDTSSLPVSVDLVTEVKAEVVNRLRDSVIATQTELGLVPSGTFGTVRARLDAIDSLLSNLGNQIASNDADIAAINVTLISLQNQITALDADLQATEAQLQQNIDDGDAILQQNIDDGYAGNQSDIASGDANLQSQIDSLVTSISEASAVVSPIVSGSQLTEATTFISVGATIINPDDLGFPNTNFTVEVILQTTNPAYAASFELFNLTEGVVVSHPTITTSSASATFISVTLSVGGSDLPNAQDNILEGRIKLATGAGSADRAICKYAAIRSVPN
jgi:hypothetical protein